MADDKLTLVQIISGIETLKKWKIYICTELMKVSCNTVATDFSSSIQNSKLIPGLVFRIN